jgi:hypothetical protein
MKLTLAAACVLAVLLMACGDDSGADPTPTGAVSGTTVATTPNAVATLDPTEEALSLILGDLSRVVIQANEVRPGYAPRISRAISKRDAVVSNVGIPPLSSFLQDSDLAGLWAALYTSQDPESAISSLVYQFGSADGAKGFLGVVRNLTQPDYPAATAVNRQQAAMVGDDSQMMEYLVPGSRTLEYTWVQGPLVGQVLIRYAGEINNPEDAAYLVELARMQSARMAAATR